MTNTMRLLGGAGITALFLLLLKLSSKANLKKKDRSCQMLEPIFASVYCVVLMVLATRLWNWMSRLLEALPAALERWGSRISLSWLSQLLTRLGQWLQELFLRINFPFLTMVALNLLILLAHVILKKVMVAISARLCRDPEFGTPVRRLFYEHDREKDYWYVRPHLGQCRTLVKTVYTAAVPVLLAMMFASAPLMSRELLDQPFFPVFGMILMGEIYYFLDGLLEQEDQENQLEGEEDDARCKCDYTVLRKALRRLFGDRLVADDITAGALSDSDMTCDELLTKMEEQVGEPVELYGRYMRSLLNRGFPVDKSSLISGRDLLEGRSILFNDPFYYDLIPYAFYAMNHTLLRHRKVLIVLGRHSVEEDIIAWCQEGLQAITGLPGLWRVGVLEQEPRPLDVGIITRSSVHDLPMHEANAEFFDEVDYVVLMEPSRLIPTAQVGLRSLAEHMSPRPVTYCSIDKNCDGLVDALSHVLMISISEVSATTRRDGACAYMCWETGREHLQHRMLPNLSRYLGMGTELSFVALKNQVSAATWYGGEAFPVTDMRWIAKQYYYDLLHYAQLPTEQEMMDRCFRVSPNLWDARVEKNQYMVVEDESFNMFEVKRDFATRIGEQGFINVITSDYLLRDYMAANEGIFNADPKAIPYIVADHARTERNVALRLCLRMSVEPVPDRELHRELMLLGADSEEPADTLWQMLCRCMQSSDVALMDDDGNPLLRLPSGGKEFLFGRRVLRSKRRFSMKTGQTETVWYIEDELFRRLVLQDLQNARYIAEDENGKPHYLGSELRGHVFQKYLPGQFFTFDGKYYEMLSVTSDGQVLLRRAADHIDGRPAYRQVRRYTLCHVCDGEDMGALRDIGGLKLRRQTADIRVETPAYWQLSRYNDFASGKHLTINGVPDRTYYRKQILRIDFPALEGTEGAAPTVALLMNEVFRTLFAENADYITAVAPAAEQPYITHTLDCTAVEEPPINGLYIIEDSPMDIGLLVAVERNLSRIFSILCDYLDWHLAALEESLHPAPQPEPPTYAIPPEEQTAEKPRKKGLLGWLGRLFRRIGDFFRKLFGKRKKPADPDQPAEPAAEPPAEGEVPPETAAPTEPDAPAEEAAPTEPDAPEEEAAPAEEETTDAPTGDAEPSEGEEPPKEDRSLFDAEPETGGPEEGEPVEPELTFEPEQVIPSGGPDLERKPYHQRYYLLYGYAEQPQDLHLQEALELLRQLGCDGGSLKQARDGQNVAELIEKNYVPNRQGVHYCDFCGVELTGAESEVLSDGRERCMNCSRTAVKTEAEFRKLYQDAARGMELFYGVRITVPVKIQMVNAKRLHRSLGKTFVPTAKPDGRTLGVAIKRGNDYSILLENGSPRMSSLMTLVHEMTHIWQYLNWDMDAIRRKYGAEMELEVYEGMAKWSEIQYAYLMGETAEAKRAEICTRVRQDEYGRGFVKYLTRYPMSHATHLEGATPFEDKETPL